VVLRDSFAHDYTLLVIYPNLHCRLDSDVVRSSSSAGPVGSTTVNASVLQRVVNNNNNNIYSTTFLIFHVLRLPPMK